MHPHSRHVPPNRSFASINAAFKPYCEARIAQVYPAGPPPSTTTSKIVSAKGNTPCLGSNTHHLIRFASYFLDSAAQESSFGLDICGIMESVEVVGRTNG